MLGRPSRAELEESVLAAGRLVGRAAVLYHSRVAECFELGASDMKALDLVEAEGPLTPAGLADRLGFAPASVTAMVDRLEAKGLLRRLPHPDDGRRLLIDFHPGARSMLAPVYGPFFASLHEMLTHYDDGELELMARAFTDIAERQLTAADQIQHRDGGPSGGSLGAS